MHEADGGGRFAATCAVKERRDGGGAGGEGGWYEASAYVGKHSLSRANESIPVI